jgi:hypothetical protein
VLVALSRVASHRRLRLGPLNAHEAAELIRSEFGHDPGPDTARVIHTRAGGNPFLIRELSRLLAGDAFTAEGPLTRDAVPATVIDVVKDRISGLEEDARDLLQTAAVMGRDVDLGLLAAASGLDIEKCLERLEPVEELGIVEPARGDPFSIRFAHDLVRESVVRDIPPSQVSRLHLRVADALERAATRDEFMVERVGHHLLAAGPMADPARTASMLIRAGRLAAGKSALEAAERQLRSAADVARRAQHSELELSALTQLTAVVGMRSMYGFSSHDLLRRAERLALSLGRDGEAAGFLFSRWAAHSHSVELHHSGPLARRLLEAGEASGDPFMLAYGLQAWGVYQWHLGNVAEGHRYLVRSTDAVLDLPPRDDDPVRHDLQLLMLGVLVETTMLSGDVETAQTLAATMEQAAGDNPYTVTIWACFAARTAVLACDPAEVMRVAEHGLPADPGFSFVYLGTYLRLARCWASAMTGASRQDAIAEAERIMAAHLEDPAKSCVATWHALLAEMRLSGGDTAGAAAALDRADFCLDAYGQRYPEGLILLTRARLQHACGEPIATVRAAAEKARAFSAERGAHLFAARAEKFLSEIG